MALRGYKNILLFDSGNIVSIEGNIFLYPEKEPSNTIIIIYILGLCVSSLILSYDHERLPAAIFSVYKQRVRSVRMRRAIIVG